MVKIKIDCQDNAAGMLRTCAAFLGWIGDIRYYMLDGRAWSIGPYGVARSDDGEETALIARQCRAFAGGRK